MSLCAVRLLRPSRSPLARHRRRAFLRVSGSEELVLAEAFREVQLERRQPKRRRPLHRV